MRPLRKLHPMSFDFKHCQAQLQPVCWAQGLKMTEHIMITPSQDGLFGQPEMRLTEQSPFMQFQKQLSPSPSSPPPRSPVQQQRQQQQQQQQQEQQQGVLGTTPVQIPPHAANSELTHLLLSRTSQPSPTSHHIALPIPLPLIQHCGLPGQPPSTDFTATLLHQPHSVRLPQLSEDPLTSAASIQHQLLHLLQQQQQQGDTRMVVPYITMSSPQRHAPLPMPMDGSSQHMQHSDAQVPDTQLQDGTSPMSESLGGLLAVTDAFASGPQLPDSFGAQHAARQAWSEWHRDERDSNTDRFRNSQPLSASLSGLLAAALPGLLEQQSMDLPSSSQLLMPSTAGVGSLTGPHVYCSNCTMPIDSITADEAGVPSRCPACHQLLRPQEVQAAQAQIQPPPLTPDNHSMLAPASPFPLSLPDVPMTPGGMDSNMFGSSGPDFGLLPETTAVQQLQDVQGPMDAGCTLLAYDERMLAHSEPQSGFGLREHPERPARLVSIMQQLKDSGLTARCRQVRGRPATDEELAAVHDPAHIRQVALASAKLQDHGPYTLSLSGNMQETPTSMTSWDETSRWIMDCPLNAHTNQAARIAAGTAVDVVLAVLQGKARNGAAIIRPPGHHAESALSMGFCIFNNAAVAARAAQKAGAKRVCIMDWDVHHGNGTQHVFYDDPSVLYVSTHRFDDGFFYPGTGSPRDAGAGEGLGYTVNVGWDGPGVTDGDMLAAFRHVVLPVMQEFDPDLVIVSAGFDAALGDPLGECLLSPALYGKLTEMMMSVAPCVLLLEGGYNLSATAACTAECVRVLLEGVSHTLPPSSPTQPSADALSALLQTLLVHSHHWPVAKVHMQQLLAEQAALEAAEQAERQEEVEGGGGEGEGEGQATLSGQMSGLGLMSDDEVGQEERPEEGHREGQERNRELEQGFSTDLDVF